MLFSKEREPVGGNNGGVWPGETTGGKTAIIDAETEPVLSL